jgi:hypothetical protein
MTAAMDGLAEARSIHSRAAAMKSTPAAPTDIYSDDGPGLTNTAQKSNSRLVEAATPMRRFHTSGFMEASLPTKDAFVFREELSWVEES